MQKNILENSADHTVHIRMSSQLFDVLKSYAVCEERSLSGMVKYIVVQHLKKIEIGNEKNS